MTSANSVIYCMIEREKGEAMKARDGVALVVILLCCVVDKLWYGRYGGEVLLFGETYSGLYRDPIWDELQVPPMVG